MSALDSGDTGWILVSSALVLFMTLAGLAMGRQFGLRLAAAVFTVVYTAALTWRILRAVTALTGPSVDEADETRGLDISIHGVEGYNL